MAVRVNPKLIDDLEVFGAEDVSRCYHCGNCSATCPFSKEPYIFPRRSMRLLQMGLEKKLEGSLEPWLCYYCGECTDDCPRDAEPGETMMSLRRWLTSRYDWTGISRLFYRSGKLELIIILLAAVLTGVGFVLWGMSKGSIYNYDGPNAFLPAESIHIFDWGLAGVLLFFLLSNCARMWWFTLGRDKSVRVPFWLYLKKAYLFPLHFVTQMRYSKCEHKRPWIIHMGLVFSYVIMLVLIMFFVREFQAGPEIAWRLHIFGYIATVGLLGATIYALQGRLRKSEAHYKHSHETDWIFLALLIFVAFTGILQHILHRVGLDAAANVAYIVHLMGIVPMLGLEVPFSKWAHLAYRPLAMYFADVRAEALRLKDEARDPFPPLRPRSRRVTMDEHKIGVYVCMCGTNIAKMVDTEAVADFAKEQPGVTVAKTYKYMCSNPGQEMIIEDIKSQGLDRVVVAACSPRMHEPTFRKALQTAGINPYFVEMANIREQCSWVHEETEEATEKARALTTAAIRRVACHEPLERRSVEMNPNVLVIGGGMVGMTAALELAEGGSRVYLVEREDHLGGNVARVDLTAPFLDSARDMITALVTRAVEHPRVEVLLDSEVLSLEGFVGNFKAVVGTLVAEGGDGSEGVKSEVEIGNVVVATGYKAFDASRVTHYGYGKLPDVITSFEFEKMLRAGRVLTVSGKEPQYVAIIHCVGSRSKEFHTYCSRVCCMTALKYAREVKSALPKSYVSDIYIDMHAFGKGHEDFYRGTSEAKTLFLMYGKNDYPVIRKADPKDGCEMLIEVNEKLSGEVIEIPADLVILMVGMEARPDSEAVARLVNISRDKDGWFIESHPKLDPVATTTEGVYIAGACAAPKDIPDSVAQARAAAGRILARTIRGTIDIDAVFAEVDPDKCSGCRICNELCPYSAISYDVEKKRSEVISALCKACGACVAACPSSAITARHFTDGQIFAQIEGVLA